MNDEFLHALRRPPSADFARKLKRQLQQQDSLRAKRFSTVRTLLTLFLIGGSALAGAYLATNRRSSEGSDESAKSLAVAEEHSSASRTQTSGPALAIASVETAAGVDDGSSAHRNDSNAAASSSATGSSALSEQSQAYEGAIRSGSTTAMGGGSKEYTAPRVDVVTSSLAYPVTKAVVDALSRGSLVKPPIDIRTEEAAAAFRILCSKSSAQAFDVVVASRRITDAELESCRRAGVPDIVGFKVGYQAVVLTGGTTSAPIKLSPRLIHLALAKQISDPAQPGHRIDNPHRSWDQIDNTLDSRAIQVLGPARGTRLRRVFETLVLGPGCDAHAGIEAMHDTDPEGYAEICYSVRADGLYQEVEQTNTMVSQNLLAEPHAIAVVDYNFYRTQRALLAGSALGDIEPTDLTLADGTYPLARPVYVYTSSNKARFDRGSVGAKFFWEFVERAAGYLPLSGLTPIDEQERKAQYERQKIPLRGASTGP